ncbi:MAG: hypothetical protein ACM3KD_11280, partial [Hyphomicrobiaceae bacterium]
IQAAARGDNGMAYLLNKDHIEAGLQRLFDLFESELRQGCDLFHAYHDAQTRLAGFTLLLAAVGAQSVVEGADRRLYRHFQQYLPDPGGVSHEDHQRPEAS